MSKSEIPIADVMDSGGSGCIRRRALEKIALLSGPTSPSSSDASDLEQLLRLLPLRKTLLNGHLAGSYRESRSDKSSLVRLRISVG